MQILAPDRRQLVPSMIVVLAVFPFCSVPVGFWAAIVIGAATVLGFICALNAVWDLRDMGWVEGIIATVWFTGMLVFAPWTLYQLATIQEFATK